MTLRKTLGVDASRVHEHIEHLLDSDDGIIVLVDRDGIVSYTHGFGVSPCQLELLTLAIERAIRDLIGTQRACGASRPSFEASEATDHAPDHA